MIKKLLHRLGVIDSTYLDARNGEYKNVFCPHCGTFIADRYRVLVKYTNAKDAMTFDCPHCGRAGAVMGVVDWEEPLLDYAKLKPNLDRMRDRWGLERKAEAGDRDE